MVAEQWMRIGAEFGSPVALLAAYDDLKNKLAAVEAENVKKEAEIGNLFRLLRTLWQDIDRGDGQFDLEAVCECDSLFVTEGGDA